MQPTTYLLMLNGTDVPRWNAFVRQFTADELVGRPTVAVVTRWRDAPTGDCVLEVICHPPLNPIVLGMAWQRTLDRAAPAVRAAPATYSHA